MGYALGSFFMLLGFLTSKPDTWETCYKPCYAEKFAANETTAEKLCVDQCVIEDAADGSHFNGSILYYKPRHNWYVLSIWNCCKFICC